MPVITLLNQKGGVGKTSTCHHLAGTLAQLGRRVLLVDNDPQSSLTQGLWGPDASRRLDPAGTIAAIYSGALPYPSDVIRPAGVAGVDLVPGSRHAASYNVPDPHLAGDESQACLRDFLDEAAGYDVTLIDCPPNLHLCSWAALVASSHLVVPLQAEDYGAQGIMDVQESLARVLAGPNPRLVLLGYLITMFNARKTVHKAYETMLRDMYGDAVFATTVPHAADYPESIAHRRPVALYKANGAAARAMKALADELGARLLRARSASDQEAA